MRTRLIPDHPPETRAQRYETPTTTTKLASNVTNAYTIPQENDVEICDLVSYHPLLPFSSTIPALDFLFVYSHLEPMDENVHLHLATFPPTPLRSSISLRSMGSMTNMQLPPHMAIRNHPRPTQFPTILRPMESMVTLQSMERSFISR